MHYTDGNAVERRSDADELLGANAGAAYNLFAYCGNNPMNIHTGWSDTNNVFVFNIFKLQDKIKS